MNKALATAIACGMLLVLPGCFIPKLRQAEPGPCMPQTFNVPQDYSVGISTENSSDIGTTEFFNDPTLASLIDQAIVGNQQLKILAQDIAVANNEIMKRRGAYLPFVTLGAGASLNKFSYNTLEGADNLQNLTPTGANFPTPYPDFLAGANLSWQIDIWRQLRNSRDAAALRYLGTRDGWNFVLTRLVADTAENYYGLMALDKQLETLNITIALQENSLEMARAKKAAARGTELAVQRFQAEVRKNQSQIQIIRQQIIETENRINFLLGRYPQPVERVSAGFIDLNLRSLSVGVPSQLLQNRPDIRQAERELEAAGLDIRVARARFYPTPMISAGVGWEAFNTRYLFVSPTSLIYNVAGDLVGPVINKMAIRADYLSANARQIEAVYNYQRTILNAFTEVVNRVNRAENYRLSVEIKKQQLESLVLAVDSAQRLFQSARVEYIDVLFSQRDFNTARMELIDTKREQLSAVVNAYQALGGGWRNVGGQMLMPPNPTPPAQGPADQVPTSPPPFNQTPANQPPADKLPTVQPPATLPAEAVPPPVQQN